MPNFFNRQDLEFLLFDVGGLTELLQRPRFAAHDRDGVEAMIDVSEQLAEEKFQPHAALIDAEEPTFDGERVHMIPEVKEALDAYNEAGLIGLPFAEAHGGLQAPFVLAKALGCIFSGANASTPAYPSLTSAAANLIAVQGSDQQKKRYLPGMLDGRFFGTMCLSEPHAGSSLGDIRTKAIEQSDGSWRIEGTKMWISAGDHELSENIVHLVLAKVDGAPAGSKGISLFVVPKFRVAEDGTIAARNDVNLAGLNHKMGQRGSINTVLNFGDAGDCHGELVGEVNKGLAGMFQMMNEARIDVGLGATMTGYAGYLEAVAYAKERPQGRPIDDPDPAKPPIPIIEHTDVRRMLLAQKAYVEGALGLILYCSELIDRETSSETQEHEWAKRLLAFLTPVAKAWPSDYCLKANELAIQVHGGYGYTRDYPVERLYRDNRINPIHEGTNGIQSIDLLGRKLPMQGGSALRAVIETMQGDIAIAKARGNEAEAGQLSEGVERLQRVSEHLLKVAQSEGPQRFMANSYVYLELVGHTVVAWMWLRQINAVALAEQETDFHAGKRQAARYFFNWELPKTVQWAELLEATDSTCLDMQVNWF